MSRVVVADDHLPTRQAVAAALSRDGFSVVGQAGSAPAAVALVRQLAPEVALLDVQMPGSGLAAAQEISTQFPGTAVVMLTVSRDDEHLFAALRAGAVGFLHKDMQLDRIPSALRGVLAGEAALPRSLMRKVMAEFRERDQRRGSERRRVHRLTDREWETLALLRQGLGTREIASRLFVEPVTVRTHVAAILRKLRVPDRAAAIQLLDDETGR